MGEKEEKGGGGSESKDRIIRIVLILILVAVVLMAVRWRMLRAELERCVELYNNYEYEEAAERLDALVGKPVSAIRIRPEARRILLLCRAYVAAEDRTLAGYEKALNFLDEAKRAGVSAEEVVPRIKEYSEYKSRMEEAEKKKAAAPPAEEPPAAESPAAPSPAE